MLSEFSLTLLVALIASSILLALVAVRFRPRENRDIATLTCGIFIGLGWLVALAAIVAKCS